jgi:acyl carrier protein
MQVLFSQRSIEGRGYMDIADIEAKVIQFIATKVENLDVSTINRSSKFDELGLDSMDTIQLLFDAEDSFGINFDSEEAKSFTTVGDIIAYIEKHQSPEPNRGPADSGMASDQEGT